MPGRTGSDRMPGPAARMADQSLGPAAVDAGQGRRLDGRQRAGHEVDGGVGVEREAGLQQPGHARLVDHHDLGAGGHDLGHGVADGAAACRRTARTASSKARRRRHPALARAPGRG